MRAAWHAATSSSSVASGRAYRRFSRIVSWKRCGSCITKPTASRSESSVRSRTSWPSTRTVPSTASAMRGTSIAVVVLPAPDGPTIATSSPGSIVRLTSRRIQALGLVVDARAGLLRATSATRPRRTGGGTTRGRTRCVPTGSTRSTAPGRSVSSAREVQHLEDPLEAHQRGQHVDPGVRELRQRLVDLAGVDDERGERADRDRVRRSPAGHRRGTRPRCRRRRRTRARRRAPGSTSPT